MFYLICFYDITFVQVPDPSRPNPEGITALHNAVCGNHKEVVRYLVEVACDINAADNNGWYVSLLLLTHPIKLFNSFNGRIFADYGQSIFFKYR